MNSGRFLGQRRTARTSRSLSAPLPTCRLLLTNNFQPPIKPPFIYSESSANNIDSSQSRSAMEIVALTRNYKAATKKRIEITSGMEASKRKDYGMLM